MNHQHLFQFKTDISDIYVSGKLNNPFGYFVPRIAQVAALELQEFIALESNSWNHDLNTERGKMFGVLVVQMPDESYAYVAAVSGNLLGEATCEEFVPPIFDETLDNHFLDRGMTELSEINTQIKSSDDAAKIAILKEQRRNKSFALQQKLFESYDFLNVKGEQKNVLKIFEQYTRDYPPAAAGDCAAPKLLQYAFANSLKPIAIAEFWWGIPSKDEEREHLEFYPSCTKKCRPILEYMLGDKDLYLRGGTKSESGAA